jgi:FixJ family two-component response regulator
MMASADSLRGEEPTLTALDADPASCRALKDIGGQLGLAVEVYPSVADLLLYGDPRRPGCLVIDLHTAGAPWSRVVSLLVDRGIVLPVILATARPEIAEAVEAIQAGAIDYLEKPMDSARLVRAIERAVAHDAKHHRRSVYCARVQRRMQRLTDSQRRVLGLVMEGRGNKAIAAELHMSVRAVEDHRAKVKKTMRVRSLAELIRAVIAVDGQHGKLPLPAESR